MSEEENARLRAELAATRAELSATKAALAAAQGAMPTPNEMAVAPSEYDEDALRRVREREELIALKMISQDIISNSRLRQLLQAASTAVSEEVGESRGEHAGFMLRLKAEMDKLANSLSTLRVQHASASQTAKREVKRIANVMGIPDQFEEDDVSDKDDDGYDDDEEEEAIVPNTTFSTTAVEALQRASTERPQIGPEQWSPRPHPLVEEAFNIIMKVPHVRQALRFELVPFLERVHEHVLAAQNQSRQLPHPHCFDRVLRRMFGGGKCQSQKTPLKFCTVVMCRLMGVATVVLTTNTSGQRDLFGKLLKFVNGSNIPCQLSTQPSRVACLV